MNNKCANNFNESEIIALDEKFKILHEKKGIKLSGWEKHINLIVVPVSINICVNSKKLKIDFIKYCKYIVDSLNNGFSGNAYSPYKNINNDPDFKYGIKYITNTLNKSKHTNTETDANTIYDFINIKSDTKIRFYLHTVVYHDTFIEESYENSSTEKFITSVNKKGFKILESTSKHLNINVINFTCSTLGLSIFPWMKYLTNKISGHMQVFIDYTTIHADFSNGKFSECKTLIHEVGHVFGLRHSFGCTSESLKAYSVLLGKIANKQILEKINSSNSKDFKDLKSLKNTKNSKDISTKTKSNVKEPIDNKDLTFMKDTLTHKKSNIQLYPDIPCQLNYTNYNPFVENKFPFYDNVPTNFACFMDYSPDDIMTHFTNSQIKIMHFMIRMFKPYLIKKTKYEIANLSNCKVKLLINKKDANTPLDNLIEDSTSHRCWIIYDNKNNFKYTIQNIDNEHAKIIYGIVNK
jgi:hypothetical protein